jgi:hypothetical protein
VLSWSVSKAASRQFSFVGGIVVSGVGGMGGLGGLVGLLSGVFEGT